MRITKGLLIERLILAVAITTALVTVVLFCLIPGRLIEPGAVYGRF